MKSELARQLRGDESVRPCVYKDSLGFDTIGIGRLVDARKKGAGLRGVEMEFMLQNDMDEKINEVNKALPWLQSLDDARRGAIVAMAFQLGTEGVLGFKTTLGLLRDGHYAEAADAMLISRWAEQTPARAKRISEQVRLGTWQYAPGA